jgi:hypothetical protein
MLTDANKHDIAHKVALIKEDIQKLEAMLHDTNLIEAFYRKSYDIAENADELRDFLFDLYADRQRHLEHPLFTRHL